jgi:hypothetical protein
MDGMKFTIDGSIKDPNTLQVWNTTWTYCQSVDRQMGQLVRSDTTGLSSPHPTYLTSGCRVRDPTSSYLTSWLPSSHDPIYFRLLPSCDPTPTSSLPAATESHLHLLYLTRLPPSLRSHLHLPLSIVRLSLFGLCFVNNDSSSSSSSDDEDDKSDDSDSSSSSRRRRRQG